ncbi:metabolite traffic protein EboE [Vallicoccus soli]|uniref:Xylose isomerase n=1 Tax=Vallicoccus soli TaxID=2339232 RepID=A0A3A3ZLH3_9ACTN|nr:metabolite traffic protein EboE [Vallicoccus soli]RJK97012.1 xylose isomerase [Vallicoccus soli]
MRLRHRSGATVHLAYCTNVHPAEDLDGVLGQLARFGEPVRADVGSPVLGLGLWLAHDVARALDDDPAAVARLRGELGRRGLEVVTLNGFPYRGFQAERVKLEVYRPDWAQRERLEHTLRLARVLAALLPDDAARGSISSLPFGWRAWWGPERQRAADAHLRELAEGLRAVRRATGREVRVGLEPEPGCTVETVEQGVRLVRDLAPDVLGLSLDACHLAVGFERPDDVVAQVRAAGVPVVKLQASAALHADDPSDPTVRAALGAFSEERFVHQVREERPGATGPLPGTDDLPEALDGALPGDRAWRVHFHVPVHAEPAGPLRSTAPELSATLRAVVAGEDPLTDHVEVETYTWGVLPEGAHPGDDAGVVRGIAAEVAWVRDELVAAGVDKEDA